MFHRWWLLLSAFLLIEYEVGIAQYLPLGSNIGAKAQLCSHTDDINGFSAIWHTNCTGHVSFVLNIANYPPIGGFWVGVGFKLLSNELALVEVVNGVVSITSAKYYEGQPPVKSASNMLLNSHGAVFPGNILEVTFAVHESLLNACKEWTFFTIPTPIGLPYALKPIRRMICNVGETCSRNNCIRDLRSDYITDPALDYGRSRFYDNYDSQYRPPYGNAINGPYGGAYDAPFFPPPRIPFMYDSPPPFPEFEQQRNRQFYPHDLQFSSQQYNPQSNFNYAQYYENNARAPPLSQLLDRSSNWPTSRSRRSSSALVRSRRLKRQTAGGIFYPNRFKGTAYEGQDAEFVREQQPYYDYYRLYDSGGYYGGRDYNNPNFGTVQRDGDAGAMYYPYRTLFTRRDDNSNSNYYYDPSRYYYYRGSVP